MAGSFLSCFLPYSSNMKKEDWLYYAKCKICNFESANPEIIDGKYYCSIHAPMEHDKINAKRMAGIARKNHNEMRKMLG